jgi:hypothetical protein
MRLKKAVITAVLGIGLSTMSFAGLDKGLAYADTTEVVYKAFDDKVSFSDKYFIYQWGMENNGDFKYNEQVGGKLTKQPVTTIKAVSGIDISLPEARAKYSGGRRETIVAIIDTGVDYRHEDLQNVLWVNKGEIPGNGIDDDNNGYVDDVNGWNFYDDNNVIYNGKDDAHGTHIAGTIVANNNTKGVAGIAGGSTVKIMVLKALGGDDESGSTSGIIEAIKYAESMGATICNFSFGTDKPDRYLEEAIKDSDMLFVVAAGNGDENTGIGYNIDTRPIYPASYRYNNIITVANLQADGNLHTSSNYSANHVDLAAPGARILSTIDTASFNAGYASGKMSSPYAYMTGTSMAAPYVVGTAALLYSDFPGITLSQVRQSILGGVKVLPELVGKVSTGGMLNADGAYAYALSNYQSFVTENKRVEEKKAEEERQIEEEKKAEEARQLEEAKKAEEVKKSEESKKAEELKKAAKKASKGKAPLIFLSLTKDGKVLVKISDKDKDVSLVRYAKGKKGDSYFTKSKKGTKLRLNKKNEKSLKLKKGVYTFYAVDKKGNRTIHTVVIR